MNELAPPEADIDADLAAVEAAKQIVDGKPDQPHTIRTEDRVLDAALANHISGAAETAGDTTIETSLGGTQMSGDPENFVGQLYPSLETPKGKTYFPPDIHVSDSYAYAKSYDAPVRIQDKQGKPATVPQLTGERARQADKIIKERAARQGLEQAAEVAEDKHRRVQAIANKNKLAES